MSTLGGKLGGPLPIHPPKDVPVCLRVRAEGDGGHQQGLPGPDTRADVLVIQLMGYKTSQEEIWGLYNEVYILRRLPSPSPCGPEWAQELTQDILSSIEDHLWQRRGDDVPKEGQEQGPTSVLLPHHQDGIPKRRP